VDHDHHPLNVPGPQWKYPLPPSHQKHDLTSLVTCSYEPHHSCFHRQLLLVYRCMYQVGQAGVPWEEKASPMVVGALMHHHSQ